MKKRNLALLISLFALAGPIQAGYIPEEIRISQNAIFVDEFTTTQVKLTLHSDFAALNHLTITAERNPTFPPENTIIVPFYDDGTNGDDVAGDGTFTALYNPESVPILSAYDGKVGDLTLWIVARDGTGTEVRSSDDINYYFNLAAVASSAAVPLTRVSYTEFTTPNLVNYIWPGITSRSQWDRSSITRRLLADYGDIFDLVTIRFAGIQAPGEVDQNFLGVMNLVQGIGKPLDPSYVGQEYGTGGTLRGVLQMGGGNSTGALLHEIGHSACYYLDDSRLRLSDNYGHITKPSTLLGQDNFSLFLLEQTNGDFVIGVNPRSRGTYLDPYSELELYLMGLIGPAEVPPERFLLDATVPATYGAVVPRDKTTVVTVDDLISVYGPRVPDSANTAKDLRMAFVVLSERPLSPAEVALEHLNATWAESRPEGATALQYPPTYYWATGGRGNLITRLPPRNTCIGDCDASGAVTVRS